MSITTEYFQILILKSNKILKKSDFIRQLAQHLDAQYKVTQDNELCVFKRIQSMK